MKKIVFIVHTEYHLIQAVGIIETHYKSEDYYPIIYRVSPLVNGRIGSINEKELNAEFREFLYDYRRPDNKVKAWANEIVKEHPIRLFIFNEEKFWVTYLLKRLSAVSCVIALAPDGAKAYNNFHIERNKYVLELCKSIYYSFRAGMLSTFPLVEKCYASNKYINEVWVEYPSFYNNNTQKKVVEYHLTEWEKTREILNKVFRFNSIDIPTKPIILYIDSSVTDDCYYDRVISMLRIIQCNNPNYNLFIKCHQVSESIAKEHFKTIGNVHFFESSTPAELIIASLKESILVSVVSTSMLLFNPTCEYIWLYPCFQDLLNLKTFINPTSHIKVISSITQL